MPSILVRCIPVKEDDFHPIRDRVGSRGIQQWLGMGAFQLII